MRWKEGRNGKRKDLKANRLKKERKKGEGTEEQRQEEKPHNIPTPNPKNNIRTILKREKAERSGNEQRFKERREFGAGLLSD